MKVVKIFALMFLSITSLKLQAVDAIHGMVIFGKDNLYAYHLPMFHKIHNKQIVLSFDLPADIKERILVAQDEGYLTFVPAPFDLDKFIAAPFDLKGDLYLGHFEKEGTVILSKITLKGPKIIYLNEIKKPDPSYKKYDYAVIGTQEDAYALHVLNGSHPVDQIYKLKTLHADGFKFAVKKHYLSSPSSLQFKNIYSIPTLSNPLDSCTLRHCTTEVALVTFEVIDSYFEDVVM